MKLLSTSENPCPCCRKTLYKSEQCLDGTKIFWTLSEGAPVIAHDDAGYYMRCLNCSRRIAFDIRGGGPSGLTLVVASKQPCL
jgi:hypothetical protein